MASDFKLFKKKDDKKNNGQNFSLSDKSKFALLSRIRPQELILCSRFPQKKKNALP